MDEIDEKTINLSKRPTIKKNAIQIPLSSLFFLAEPKEIIEISFKFRYKFNKIPEKFGCKTYFLTYMYLFTNLKLNSPSLLFSNKTSVHVSR